MLNGIGITLHPIVTSQAQPIKLDRNGFWCQAFHCPPAVHNRGIVVNAGGRVKALRNHQNLTDVF